MHDCAATCTRSLPAYMNEAVLRGCASGCVGWHPRVAVLLLTFSFSLASVLCYHLPTMSCVYMKIKTFLNFWRAAPLHKLVSMYKIRARIRAKLRHLNTHTLFPAVIFTPNVSSSFGHKLDDYVLISTRVCSSQHGGFMGDKLCPRERPSSPRFSFSGFGGCGALTETASSCRRMVHSALRPRVSVIGKLLTGIVMIMKELFSAARSTAMAATICGFTRTILRTGIQLCRERGALHLVYAVCHESMPAMLERPTKQLKAHHLNGPVLVLLLLLRTATTAKRRCSFWMDQRRRRRRRRIAASYAAFDRSP
jgi:hypothetical protein